jgi:hypothetical protein
MPWYIKVSVFFTILFIRVTYGLGLRKLWTYFSRYIFQGRGRTELPTLDDPQAVENLLAKCQYRADPFSGKWDFIYSPEYIMWLIENHDYENFPKGPYIGDCDDFHFLGAHLMSKIAGVSDVHYLSSGFYGPKRPKRKSGAHATFTYVFNGREYHLDYRIRNIDKAQDAPQAVAERYGKDGGVVTYWVWETVVPKWKPVAITPKELVVE